MRLKGLNKNLIGALIGAPTGLALAAGIWAISHSDYEEAAETGRFFGPRFWMSQLAFGLRAYADKNDGYLPPADRWLEAAERAGKIDHRIYFAGEKGRRDRAKRHIAFNEALAGKKLDDIPGAEKVVMLFWSTKIEDNAHDKVESIQRSPRGSTLVAMAQYGSRILRGDEKAGPSPLNGKLTGPAKR